VARFELVKNDSAAILDMDRELGGRSSQTRPTGRSGT